MARGESGLGRRAGSMVNWLWIVLILSLKKDRKLLHFSTENE